MDGVLSTAGINNLTATQKCLDSSYLMSLQFLDPGDLTYSSVSPFSSGAGASIFNGGLGCLGNGLSFNGGFNGGLYGPTEADITKRNSMTSQEYANDQEKTQLLHQEEMERLQIAKQTRQKQLLSVAEIKSNSPDDSIAMEAGHLQNLVNKNKQDTIATQYVKLTQAIKNKFEQSGYMEPTNLKDKLAYENEIKSQAYNAYYAITKKNLADDLEEKGCGNFIKGVKEGSFFGLGYVLGDKTCTEENIEKITGDEASPSSEAKRWTGRVVGGAGSAALVGAAIIVGIKLLTRGRA